MEQSATFDRSAIMTAAWAAYRKFYRFPTFNAHMFARELSVAWDKAKSALRRATQTEADRITEAIDCLESKDRWTQADYARRNELAAALEIAEGHEAAAPEYAEKRSLIEKAKGRFCAVTFTKADGTERTMKVQPATLKHHVKGDAATEAGKKAVATRKARHPHLLPVWDAEAQAPRSVNLATVSRISVDGQVHHYAA